MTDYDEFALANDVGFIIDNLVWKTEDLRTGEQYTEPVPDWIKDRMKHLVREPDTGRGK